MRCTWCVRWTRGRRAAASRHGNAAFVGGEQAMVGYLKDARAAAHRTGHRLVEATGACISGGCQGAPTQVELVKTIGNEELGRGTGPDLQGDAALGTGHRCTGPRGGTGLRIRCGAGRMLKGRQPQPATRNPSTRNTNTMKKSMNIPLSALAVLVSITLGCTGQPQTRAVG